MSKADEAFEHEWSNYHITEGGTDAQYFNQVVKRLAASFYREGYRARGVADVEAVRAAFDAIPDAIAGSGLDLAEDATARIAALDEGGGE